MEKDYLKKLRGSKFDSFEIPMVSVVTTAFNIEKFLPEAIESVLNQATNFKVEMVIGEDCSTDNTRQIALDYQKKYPEIIRVLLPESNQGITPNCIATHNACRGKYIALLDGDDFWISENKLQKQIDFLESNSEYSGSAHQSIVIYEDSKVKHKFGEDKDLDFEVKDTISNRKFHTSSLVYRKEIWDKVNGIPPTVAVSNDRAIYPMVAVFGKIKYFKDLHCVYRKTGYGISSTAKYFQIKTELDIIPWIRKIDRNFPYVRFSSFLHYSIFTNSKSVKTSVLIKHYILFAIFSFSYFPKNLGDLKHGSLEFIKRLR